MLVWGYNIPLPFVHDRDNRKYECPADMPELAIYIDPKNAKRAKRRMTRRLELCGLFRNCIKEIQEALVELEDKVKNNVTTEQSLAEYQTYLRRISLYESLIRAFKFEMDILQQIMETHRVTPEQEQVLRDHFKRMVKLDQEGKAVWGDKIWLGLRIPGQGVVYRECIECISIRHLSSEQGITTSQYQTIIQKSSEHRSYICLSLASSTVVLNVGEDVKEAAETGLLSTVRSIFVGSLVDDSLIQVNSRGLSPCSSSL